MKHILLGTLSIELERYMLPCMSKQLLGIDCPGCGFQRAVVLFLKGNFEEAFFMYPALYGLMLLFGFFALNKFVHIKYSNTITIILSVTTVLMILINYILKITH